MEEYPYASNFPIPQAPEAYFLFPKNFSPSRAPEKETSGPVEIETVVLP